MKNLFAAALLAPMLICGQATSVSTTTKVDINGHRVLDGPREVITKAPSGTETTETMQSINGRMVPLERVEQRVLRDDASGRLVERVVRRYDPQGNLTAPVRQTIEEQKRTDGGSTVVATTYRTDINGHSQLEQKSVTETRKTGAEERSETLVERPTLNGSLETVEKQEQVKVGQGNSFRQEATTYRPDGHGGFYPAVRSVMDHAQSGAQTTENTVEYEASPGGPLQVHNQTVAKTVTAADGSKDTTVDIYGSNVPGTVSAPGSAMKLQEQQLVESQKNPNGTVTETLSVRRPTVSDPNKLAPPQQLSQTVCRGDCKP